MRFFGAFFLGVCYANVAERSDAEPVLTTLIPEVANPPRETQASVDARLALVAVCPEATSDCSVPTGPEAQNEELADALDCMLKINITTIPAGPCHDVLEQFLRDHLSPRMSPQGTMGRPQFPMSPTMLIMRPQPGMAPPSPIAELLQRMAANSRPAPQPMMFPMQDPRYQQPFSGPQSRFPPSFPGPQSRESGRYSLDRDDFPTHGFPPMGRAPWMDRDRDHSEMRSYDRRSDDRHSYGRRSSDRGSSDRYSRSDEEEEDGHWDYVWHSTRDEPEYNSYRSHGSPRHMPSRMPFPPSHRMPSPPSHRMPSPPSHRMPSPPSHRMPFPPSQRMPYPSQRMSSPPSLRMPSPPARPMPSSSRRGPPSHMSSSSSSMNPMMMMLLPRLMSQGSSSSSQSPMSGILMATLMKNMAGTSESYDDYDYDYGYDYDNDEALDDYDYDYDYEDEPVTPSPLAEMIQKMLQQKLAARQQTIQVTMQPAVVAPVDVVAVPSEISTDDSSVPQPVNVEIAQSSRPRSDKETRTEQVSYRSAP